MYNVDTTKGLNQRVEAGTYEVFINNMSEEALPSGKEFISVDILIRNDVNQQFKDRQFKERLWMKKDGTGYVLALLGSIKKALGNEGEFNYPSFAKMREDFLRKPFQVKIDWTTTKNEATGKEYTNLNFLEVNPSAMPGLNHHFTPKQQVGQPIVINENDTPF
ncbi:DUF669 domain-containing protein [Paenilisteria newyorkensis]|uniref:DUF669 domain-containing protein n=1 Tax=Listeria newyorkensis TaxID=1497681 RepID=UPI0023592580|nr:DUF669 domain-containing protein [Listeria newyorkensis]WAO22052.1 DUF669 domain-containing protein [Listeria newyorkensis]